jgi:hypothetical protein
MVEVKFENVPKDERSRIVAALQKFTGGRGALEAKIKGGGERPHVERAYLFPIDAPWEDVTQRAREDLPIYLYGVAGLYPPRSTPDPLTGPRGRPTIG